MTDQQKHQHMTAPPSPDQMASEITLVREAVPAGKVKGFEPIFERKPEPAFMRSQLTEMPESEV